MGRPKKQKDVVVDVTAASDALDEKGGSEVLPTHHLENPDKVSGELLRRLAHRHGLSKSELATMSDEKIRAQMKVLAYQRHEEDAFI